MKIVVGLGNPGDKYFGTRHNVGFEVLTELNLRFSAGRPKSKFEAEVTEIVCGTEKLLLVAPQTYMNLSGRSVQQFVRFHQIPLADLMVICDDLDLKVGQIRARASGSAGGQKGLQSIISCLGSPDFPRLRLGIGRPAPPIETVDYVLGRFRSDERILMDGAVSRAASAVECWATNGLNAAMNRFNGEIENVVPDNPPQNKLAKTGKQIKSDKAGKLDAAED